MLCLYEHVKSVIYIDIRLSGQDDVSRAVPIGREVSINDVQLKAGGE